MSAGAPADVRTARAERARVRPGRHEKNGTRKQRKALILPGAGARGAYQVGVLKAIAQLLPRRAVNPFAIICGTSAGAINAAVLASRAAQFERAVSEMERVWSNFHADQVYRSDNWTMLKTSLHWFAAVIFGGLGVRNPLSLLDNAPLCELLARRIPFGSITRAIDRGYVEALAVTASAYTSAQSVTFFQALGHVEPWVRVRRVGRPARIGIEHLLASAAVPFIFPPVRIGGEFYGDGSMRNRAPLSPAIHLGADRILVIGGRDEQPIAEPLADDEPEIPTFGHLGGYMLDTLFLDGLYADLEHVTRTNQMLKEIGVDRLRTPEHELRRLTTLIVLPKQDIRDVAARHVDELPYGVRLLLRGLGAMNHLGMQLVSYLLFESGFTQELISMGYRDAMSMEDDLRAFLSDEPMASLDAPTYLKERLES
ncbi:MAG TPA: patatin-like phospholipase family protein [Gammaproteobacteria bacterium]|nr:patatin-like phospholipase family protein [Gammaproteobacteria bacterium]